MSKPLHYFTLPQLKWNKDRNSAAIPRHHRPPFPLPPSQRHPHAVPSEQSSSETSDHADSAAISVESPPSSKESPKSPTIRELLKDSSAALLNWRMIGRDSGSKNKPDLDNSKLRVYSSNFKKSSQNQKPEETADAGPGGSKKNLPLLVKIPQVKKVTAKSEPEKELAAVNKTKTNISLYEEFKTWNLRPRKTTNKVANAGAGAGAVSVKGTNDNDSKGKKEEEKRKLTVEIALTKEEIEQDFFSLTGSKPSRKPKKRPKNVQKKLDFVFPGLALVSITPNSYKVSEV